jgi:hypothetical protein
MGSGMEVKTVRRLTRKQWNTSIFELEFHGLSVLIIAFLEREYRARSIGDLCDISPEEIVTRKGFGVARLRQLNASLASFFRKSNQIKELVLTPSEL